MDRPQLVYPFTCQWTCELFPPFDYCEWCCYKHCVVFVWTPVLNSLGYISRSRSARLHGMSMFNFLKNCQTALQSYIILHFHQQCMRVLISLHPCQHNICLLKFSYPSEWEVIFYYGFLTHIFKRASKSGSRTSLDMWHEVFLCYLLVTFWACLLEQSQNNWKIKDNPWKSGGQELCQCV